jgi:hypothetical protein
MTTSMRQNRKPRKPRKPRLDLSLDYSHPVQVAECLRILALLEPQGNRINTAKEFLLVLKRIEPEVRDTFLNELITACERTLAAESEVVK